MITDWSQKWAPGSTFWFLGDWGNLEYLWTMQLLRDAGMTTKMVYGNHDHLADKRFFEEVFDEVYEYPTFLSQKLVVSHYPVAVYDSAICVHGHLHNSKLSLPNYVNASVHVAHYQPISTKYLDSVFSRIPQFQTRFLYEPWAANYQFVDNKQDVVMDREGKIDLSASRVIFKIQHQNPSKEDSYQPYTGGL